MKLSYNWLKDFIDLPASPDEIIEKLTLIGLEVEEVEPYGSLLEGVVVGEVLTVKPHPNADRLQLCTVNLGNSQTQIVCGAKNVAAGQKVPVATVGTTLPIKLEDGSFLKIKKAKLRGEASEGMICSESELGFSDDHSGIMVLDESLKPGTPIHEVMEDLYEDTIITIAITPNRPDATCHLGVARDLAAALNLELRKPYANRKNIPAVSTSSDLSITIKNPEKCHRYVGLLVRNVEIKESPAWLKNRIRAIGLRPVNNVVDITNYVMYELGQPLHAFDYDQIAGKEIIVQDFAEPKEFETLDHVKRTCQPGTLFICDANGSVAIAGVMGGLHSEVSQSTKNVLIESAYFDPGTVRKTAKEQALQSDASYRFERGIDPEMQALAAVRAAELMAEIAGGSISDELIDVHPVKTEPRTLTLRMSYLNRLLGTDLDVDTTLSILKGLELETLSKTNNSITFRIPTFRPDLEREVDLIEEVGRLFDYNKISSPSHGIYVSAEAIGPWEQLNSKAKEISLQLGLREIYSNSLISEKEAANFSSLDKMIPTLNPLTKDMSTLRPNLLHGFLKSAAYNFNRRASSVRFFEIGHVFEAAEQGTYFEGIRESVHYLIGISGLKQTEHWSAEVRPYTFMDLKTLVHHFFLKLNLDAHLESEMADEQTLIYSYKGREVGTLFEVGKELKKIYDIDHNTFVAELSLSAIHEILEAIPPKTFKAVPKYPVFEFDFAVVIDKNIAAGQVIDEIKKHAGNLLESIDIFDVFEGEAIGNANKSIAFRLNFIDPNKTLNIKDVEPIIQRILKQLENKFSAKLRS